MASVNFWS